MACDCMGSNTVPGQNPDSQLDHDSSLDVGDDFGRRDEHGQYGSEQPIAHDSRRRVTRTTEAPFRYICNLEFDFAQAGRWGMCTGTLIGPRTVLTAGHCLVAGGSELREASRIRVIPGRDGSSEPLPATIASRLFVPKDFKGSSASDFGIIQLEDPIGDSVGYWGKQARPSALDAVGSSILRGRLPLPAGRLKLNISGYPADKPAGRQFGCWDPKQPERRCRHTLIGAPGRKRVCGTVPYRSYNRTTLLRFGMLHYLNDTCPGHSGSPVWVRRHSNQGGRVLVGVHVAGDDPRQPGVANRAVFMGTRLRDFIGRHWL